MNLFKGVATAVASFFVLSAADPSVERTFVIGDVHGCLDELNHLLSNVNYDTKVDKLIFVGDLVNKGPKSLEVVRWVKNHPGWKDGRVRSVKGNHEISVLIGAAKGQYDKLEPWTQQLSDEELEWINALPLFIRLPKAIIDPKRVAEGKKDKLRDVLIVHAGVVAEIPVEEQPASTLTKIRTLKNNEPSPDHDGAPWFKQWKGPEFIIYGHDASLGEVPRKHSHGIDGGACYGRQLIALELPAGKTHRVDSARDYVEKK